MDQAYRRQAGRERVLNYHIKEGYKENKVAYFLDNLKATRGIVFQPDVYTFAEQCCKMMGLNRIVDVGCGQADKLADIHERHKGWDFLGVDFGKNIEYCASYDWGTWSEADLEDDLILPAAGSVVICSDVIEHLADPVPLLKSLRKSRAELIVLSTPERDLQHGLDHMGPSPNINHVREWNYDELHSFLEDEGFTIRFHGLTRSSDHGPYCQTQLVVM